MNLFSRTAIILAVAVLVSGCGVSSTVETSRQLDHGDTVLSTNFGWPGYLIILPRVNVLGMAGLGDVADVSAHIGLNRTSVNAGLGTRGYLGEQLVIGLRGDIERLGDDPQVRGIPLDGRVLTTLTPRVITATDDDQWLYGGAQASILHNFSDEFADNSGTFFAYTVGAVGGFDYLFTTRGFQAEFVFSLIAFDDAVFEGGIVPSVQFSIGGYLYNPFSD